MNWITKILAHEVWDVTIPDINRNWTGIIFHHTVHISDDDQGEYIEDLHLNGKREGYPAFRHGMGYHNLVNRSGNIEVGKRWLRQLYGAHCRTDKKSYNHDYIGVCLAGNLEVQETTKEQVDSLLKLLKALKYTTGRPHHFFKNTLCPGKNFPYEDVNKCLNEMKLRRK